MVSVLGIDTSAAACSVALWRDGAVVAEESLAMARGHAETLMPMIERVMAEAKAAYRDLAAVAATAGPGAFTGLRIGLACARGLALAAAIPAIGISAFDALAAAVPEAARRGRAVAVVIDTKRGDLYLHRFDAASAPLGAGHVATIDEALALLGAAPHYVTGDGVPMLRASPAAAAADLAFDPAPAPPRAPCIAALGAAALDRAPSTPLPPPEPLYLRAAEATPLALQVKGRRPA